jgi:hypothetical protein
MADLIMISEAWQNNLDQKIESGNTAMESKTENYPMVHLAGTLYRSREREMGILQLFADELTGQGLKVGGIVQEALRNLDGSISGLDVVELDTGHRIAINRPKKSQSISKTCSLDTQALAETSSAVQRAITQGVDLIIVEKYGEQEQLGQGLADDILQAASEGIPTLVAVPDGVCDKWREFTGGMSDEIPYSLVAFRSWWEQVLQHRIQP